MARLKFHGPYRHRLRSFLTLQRIFITVCARHLMGRRMAPEWNVQMETGIRFWRHQFTVAMNHADIQTGRSIYNSLQTLNDDVYRVVQKPSTEMPGIWFEPATLHSDRTILYLHGGGYTFGGPNARQFAAMLAHRTGARLFMPRYRRTPENIHPAQAEDALRAFNHLRQHTDARDIVLVGDSAGGHMALMLLLSLRARDAPQPGLCIGLCPWTDVGARGASLTANNRYDLVQGWMALRFGTWLDPEGAIGREGLSPVFQDFSGLAPIYMQAGGREILRDMIVEFAAVQAENGADIMLDVWDDMPHDFQAYDSMFASSTQALARIATVMQAAEEDRLQLPSLPGITRYRQGLFAGEDHAPANIKMQRSKIPAPQGAGLARAADGAISPMDSQRNFS